jgi:antitoxin component of RelBE/YafQ-DinJ toxin-antitoxin module
MVFAQVELKNGVPFPVTTTDDGYLPHIPNAETLAALREKSGRRFQRVGAFLADLQK